MSKVIAAAAIAALVGGLWWLSSTEDGDDESDSETSIPKDQVLEFLKRLQEEIPAKLAPQQIATIRGQPVNKAEIMKVIAQQFDNMCVAVQNELFQEMGIDEEEMAHATRYYMGQEDEDVVEAVHDFRSLYTQYGGSVEVDLPKDLDEDKMCAAFDAYVAARDEAENGYIKELQKRQGNISPDRHTVLMKRANHLMVNALKKHGLTVFQFQTASKEFAERSPKFHEKHAKDEEEQEAKRQSISQMGQR